MAAASWIVPLQLAAAAQGDVASSMGAGARDRQEVGLAATSQLGLDPSVDEEGVNHGGVEVGGVMQLETWSGAQKIGGSRLDTRSSLSFVGKRKG